VPVRESELALVGGFERGCSLGSRLELTLLEPQFDNIDLMHPIGFEVETLPSR
jgi:hypothetical protein